MGIDFGVIWVAGFNNVIRFYVSRRPFDKAGRGTSNLMSVLKFAAQITPSSIPKSISVIFVVKAGGE